QRARSVALAPFVGASRFETRLELPVAPFEGILITSEAQSGRPEHFPCRYRALARLCWGSRDDEPYCDPLTCQLSFALHAPRPLRTARPMDLRLGCSERTWPEIAFPSQPAQLFRRRPNRDPALPAT